MRQVRSRSGWGRVGAVKDWPSSLAGSGACRRGVHVRGRRCDGLGSLMACRFPNLLSTTRTSRCARYPRGRSTSCPGLEFLTSLSRASIASGGSVALWRPAGGWLSLPTGLPLPGSRPPAETLEAVVSLVLPGQLPPGSTCGSCSSSGFICMSTVTRNCRPASVPTARSAPKPAGSVVRPEHPMSCWPPLTSNRRYGA